MSLNNTIHTINNASTDNVTITNLSEIANALNNCFAKVAVDIQTSIRFFKKKYFDYVPPLNVESLILLKVLKCPILFLL